MSHLASPQVSLAKDRINILLLEGVHDSAIKVLQQHGYTNIRALPTSLAEAELIEACQEAHFIGIRSRTQLTAKVFAAAENW